MWSWGCKIAILYFTIKVIDDCPFIPTNNMTVVGTRVPVISTREPGRERIAERGPMKSQSRQQVQTLVTDLDVV